MAKVQLYSLLGLILVACLLYFSMDTEPKEKTSLPAKTAPDKTKIEQHVAEPEKILNLGITTKEFKSAFDRMAVERNVSQLVLNNIQSFDNGGKFVQQYPAGLYLFGVVDKETGFLKEIIIGKEFILSESKRQSEVDVTGVAFLVAVAALNPESTKASHCL